MNTNNLSHLVKVDTKALLKEVLSNQSTWVLKVPLTTLHSLLRQVAARAIELNDTELNKLMLRLGLYSISEPGSPDFDLKAVNDYLTTNI